MSSTPRTHGDDHAELVLLYALQALPASEVRVAEANISACSDCRHELETLRPPGEADNCVEVIPCTLQMGAGSSVTLSRCFCAGTQ